jgi:hypothetical protein
VVAALWWWHCGGSIVVAALWWQHCGGGIVVAALCELNLISAFLLQNRSHKHLMKIRLEKSTPYLTNNHKTVT